MSLNFAGISPHPPIIIPSIGNPEDLQKVSDTIVGMRKLSHAFNEAEIDTLIVISPHSLIYPDRFNICGMRKLFGTFASFGKPEIIVESSNELNLVEAIVKKCEEANIDTYLYDNGGEFFELDHGIMVPLTYLKKEQESSFRVVPIAYSNLDRTRHFAFGQAIKEAAERFPGRVGILASGDLSHQLFQNPEGKKFDQKLISDLKDLNTEDILYYDEEWIEGVGECGYRSILILLGALDNVQVTPEIFSYEGPFGVGYLTANFKLPEAG